MTILDQHGSPATSQSADDAAKCDHGVTFDEQEAAKLLDGWRAKSPVEFIMGNPGAKEVRKRWPRLQGTCPKGCGFVGIGYASYAHYLMGDW